MFSKYLKVSLLIVSISGFVSCSKIDEMGKNAKSASDNSGKAATAASDSREEIANGRMMTRSAGASASRREALEGLMKMKSFEMKVLEATKFVKAFEYQLWTGQRYDTEQYLLVLYNDAMKEFFRSFYEVNDGESILKTGQTPFRVFSGARDRDLNVYALAVAMHGVHNVQEQVVVPREASRTTTVSIYDLIKNSLRRIAAVEKGELSFSSLEEYEYTVYNYKEEAMQVIKDRLDMFLTMNLVKISSIQDSKLEAFLLGLSFWSNSFTSKFVELNLGAKKRANDYLDAARKVKVFLNEMDEEITLLPKLVTYYQKMTITPANDEVLSIMSTDDQTLVEEHISLLSNFFEVDESRLN